MGWGDLAPFLLALGGLLAAVSAMREKSAASDVRLIQAQEQRITVLEKKVSDGEETVTALRDKIDNLEEEVAKRDTRIAVLEHELAAAQEKIKVLEAAPMREVNGETNE